MNMILNSFSFVSKKVKIMDHIVYLDFKAKELEKLKQGDKKMIIRGATGRKLPYGRVFEKDILYLVNNNSEGLIKARCTVKSVFNSEKMDKETSEALVAKNQEKLQLAPHQAKRWAGKRYLVLIEIDCFEELQPFAFDKSNYGNMDDWLPVEDIESVKAV